ncbi:MAG: hypothetical protein LBF88_14280 [Planctomycetaceae bacterium]|nr:hypothetical protein [Planctomycetaceae bacterium]
MGNLSPKIASVEYSLTPAGNVLPQYFVIESTLCRKANVPAPSKSQPARPFRERIACLCCGYVTMDSQYYAKKRLRNY